MYPFATFPPNIVFHVSACRSSTFNHLLFKRVCSPHLPWYEKYPNYQGPSLNHIFHENFLDFVFPPQDMIVSISESSCLFISTIW